MLKRIWDAIRGVGPGISIVEIDSRLNLIRGDDDSIASLAQHPGFVALTNRFQMQKAFLEAKLKRERQKRTEDYFNLQNGIEWADFYNAQVDKAVMKKKEVQAVLPKPNERAEFERVFAQFTGV